MKKIFPIMLLTATGVAVYLLKKYFDAQNKPISEQEIPDPLFQDETVKSSVTPPLKPHESAVRPDDENMRLLKLQADLVMANYPHEKIFLVQHHVSCEDEDKLEIMMEEFKQQDYIIIRKNAEITIEKVLLKSDNEIVADIMAVAARVRKDDGVYKGFNVIPQ
ncbi:MAG: hypothetical protein VB012_05995 [Erysipelotrichaceae bacterium]|nr:hypothetical protein [Erysipelotrichaceae bacterium]